MEISCETKKKYPLPHPLTIYVLVSTVPFERLVNKMIKLDRYFAEDLGTCMS